MSTSSVFSFEEHKLNDLFNIQLTYNFDPLQMMIRNILMA